MPAIPNLLERVVLLTLNKAPAPVLDLVGAATLQAQTTALELGLFEALSEGPLTMDALAQATGTDPEAIGHLVDLLAATGYLDTDGQEVALTRMSRTWLSQGSPRNLGPWFTLWQDLILPFLDEHLETVMTEGQPPVTLYEWFEEVPERWEPAQATFEHLARLVTDEITEAIPAPSGPARVLDLGGGHGLFATALCQAHPELAATVLDMPGALIRTQANAEEAGVGDRVTAQPGDYLEDDLGQGWDLVLLFNVLHGHRASEAGALIDRAIGALAPGGQVVIYDQFTGPTPGPATKAAVAMLDLMYHAALGGQAHDRAWIEAKLDDGGMADVSWTALRSAPGAHLVTARRPPV